MIDIEDKIIAQFDIVTISIPITLTRILFLVLIFVPLFISENLERNYATYIRSLSIVFIVVFFAFIILKSNYKKTGNLFFTTSNIIIENKNIKNIIATDNLDINISYSGFKGEEYEYKIPIFISVVPKDGVNDISIISENKNYNLKFLTRSKNDLKMLKQLKNMYTNCCFRIVVETTD